MTVSRETFTVDLIRQLKAMMSNDIPRGRMIVYLTPSEFADPRLRDAFPGYIVRKTEPLP